LVYSVTIATFTILTAPRAEAYTTWTITIDATGNGAKPAGYSLSRTDTGIPCKETNSNSDAPNLTVCPNDLILWVASTAPGSSGKKKNELFIFHEDAILLDGDGNSVQTLHSSNGVPTGGTVDPRATLLGHEYYVVVYDKSNKKWYMEDPKIIIGGAQVPPLMEDIQKNCKQLILLLDKYTELSQDSNDQAIKACRQLGEISIPKN
jgi:hypothetical protein